MAGLLKINGVNRNYRLGSVQISWPRDSPYQMQILIDAESPEGLPTIGQRVEFYLSSGTKRFGGTIRELGREGIYQGSTRLQIPITVNGYNVRMYERVARDRLTGILPRFKSYSSTVDTAATVVTRTDGDRFDPELVGKSVKIGDYNYAVASVQSPDKLTLSTSAGTQTAAAMTLDVYSGDVAAALISNTGKYMDGEGFTAYIDANPDNNSIQKGAKISELFFGPDPVYVSAALDKLVELNPTFAWWTDEEQVVYFRDRGDTAAPIEFTDTSGAYRRDLGITTTREDVRNVELSLLNNTVLVETTDTINGVTASPQRSWFLSKPLGQFVSMKLNEVDVNASTDLTSDADYFYVPNTRQLWQNPVLPAIADGDSLVIKYYPLGDNIQEYEDSAAVAARRAIESTGSGRVELIVDRTSSPGQVEALTEAQNSVSRFKEDLKRVKGVTWEAGLMVCQVVKLQSAKLGLDLGNFYIDQLSATDKGCEGTSHDLLYTIDAVSASRRTAAQVFRDLTQAKTGTGSVVVTGGGSGGSGGDPDVPGEVSFTPARYEYGMFTIENCSVPSTNTKTLRGMTVYLFHVDETRSDVFATLGGALNATDDPATVAVTINPDKVSSDTFLEGDYILINDPGKYEIAQIKTISGGSWVLDRHYVSGAAGEAQFKSQMASHSAGVKVYRVSSREFMTSQRTGNFGESQNIVSRFDMEAAGICVLAVVAACWNDKGYGPWAVVNCATATVPGIRTHVGGNYTFQRPGRLSLVTGMPKDVQFASSIRVMFAKLVTGPTGANATAKVSRSSDQGDTWVDLATLTILDGAKVSYPTGEGDPAPEDKEMPYGAAWPPPILSPGDIIRYQITGAGSTDAGEDLSVEVYT